MGQPRAKRRRRLTVLSSDDEGEDSSADAVGKGKSAGAETLSSSGANGVHHVYEASFEKGTKERRRPGSYSQSTTESGRFAPVVAPVKTISSATQLDEVKRRDLKAEESRTKFKSKAIYSFFNAATQRQQQRSTSPEEDGGTEDRVEQIVEYRSSDDDSRRAAGTTSSSTAVLAYRKRSRTTAKTEGNKEVTCHVPSNSQRFSKTLKDGKTEPNSTRKAAQDPRPWVERYGPANLDELAVHNRKISDVRSWLEKVFAGRSRQRLLLLKGAAGTGKTTTISLLARLLGYEILEWHNPIGVDFASEEFVSVSTLFDEFIQRTAKFASLEICHSNGKVDDKPCVNGAADNGKQVIVIEEFPNTFSRSSSALQSFRATIKEYLAASTPSVGLSFSDQAGRSSATPIVMIISETLLSTTTAAADSFTAYRLLGPDILHHPSVNVIEFNAIAPTILAKALGLVLTKEAHDSGRSKTPMTHVIKQIAQIGDVRSAISTLEFLCLRDDDGINLWSTNAVPKKTKRVAKRPPELTQLERASLEMITQREATLGLFHSIGKVVYNKRDDGTSSSTSTVPAPQPPPFLTHLARPNASLVDIDALHADLGTDTHTFVAALHENYVLSCGSDSAEDTLDSVNGCIDTLSDADLLSPERFAAIARGGASDAFRQDEIAFQASVRGLLFHLPWPVKRSVAPAQGSGTKAARSGGGGAGRAGDAFRMFYPMSLKVWRRKEEIEALLELYVDRAVRGELPLGLASGTEHRVVRQEGGRVSGVESWRSVDTGAGLASASVELPSSLPGEVREGTPQLIGSGGAARREMLLETLPYVAQILRSVKAKQAGAMAPGLRDLETMTTFSGIRDQEDEEEDTEGDEGIVGGAVQGMEGATDWAGTESRALARGRAQGSWEGWRGRRYGGEYEGGGASVDGIDGRRGGGERKLVLSDDDIEDD